MSAEELSLIAGAVLSILFEYVPGLSAWYTSQGPQMKKMVMAGVLLATAVGIFVLGCRGWIAGVACTWAGVGHLALLWVMAIVGNQGMHLLSKRSKVDVPSRDETG